MTDSDQEVLFDTDRNVPADTDRIKKLRLEKIGSIGALEKVINQLHDQRRCKKKIGKSILQRIETSDGKPIPFWQIQTIAMALDVEPDSLKQTGGVQKIKTINLSMVHKGSTFTTMLTGQCLYTFHIDEEPGRVEAQDAIIKLIEKLDEQRTNRFNTLLESTKNDFELRQQLEILKSNGLGVFIGKSKQVAPWSVGESPDDPGSYMLLDDPDYSDELWNHFEGVGLCDVVLISINKVSETFVEIEHDMDPANLIKIPNRNAFLIENIQRLIDGEEELTAQEFYEISEDQFVSNKAREIELKRREEAKGETNEFEL
jgi:hypothetical protein